LRPRHAKGKLALSFQVAVAMRAVLALLLVPVCLVGCTPNIPIKPDFGVSALAPKPDTPPEFAAFNNYDPATNALLASQMCATGYAPLQQKNLGASTGSIVEGRYRCLEHLPFLGIYQ
jgi:hypothetical protein